MKKFSEEEINEILQKYDNGEKITNLNKFYHTTKVRDILIQNNRSVPEVRKGQGGVKRKYPFNENYFSEKKTSGGCTLYLTTRRRRNF